MCFLKKNGRTIFYISFCLFILLQQVAVQYGRAYRASTTDVKEYDAVVAYELNQLGTLWKKTETQDLITPGRMANHDYLEQARIRLQEAELGIQESESRVLGVTGGKQEFFQKVHAYYHHSVLALINIINFLLKNREEYLVEGNEISFRSDEDAETLRVLISKLSDLYQEKENLDRFILNHNAALEGIQQ